MMFSLLSDLLKVDDLLLIVKNEGTVSEIRSNSLSIRKNEKWITIGDNDGPAHMHINTEIISSAIFVEEAKPERTSFSVQFFDAKKERILGVFFTKMYDENQNLIMSRKNIFDDLQIKYGKSIQL